MEGYVAATSVWSMFFFLAFYLFTVVIFLNVLIGFLIDSFNVMQPFNKRILSLAWQRSRAISREANAQQVNSNTLAHLLMKLDESTVMLRETSRDNGRCRLEDDRKLQRRLGLDLVHRKHAHSILMLLYEVDKQL